MNKLRRLLVIVVTAGISSTALAQFDESGIAAGFFDSSKDHWRFCLKTQNQLHRL